MRDAVSSSSLSSSFLQGMPPGHDEAEVQWLLADGLCAAWQHALAARLPLESGAVPELASPRGAEAAETSTRADVQTQLKLQGHAAEAGEWVVQLPSSPGQPQWTLQAQPARFDGPQAHVPWTLTLQLGTPLPSEAVAVASCLPALQTRLLKRGLPVEGVSLRHGEDAAVDTDGQAAPVEQERRRLGAER